MAPECVRNKGSPDPASDIWSLGVLLYYLETGLLPFRGGSDYLIFRRSTEARYNTNIPILSDQAKALIDRCIKVDPKERATIDELLQDPYFDDIQEGPLVELTD